MINKVFRLAARPVGLPRRSDWTYETAPVGEPGDGEVLVRTRYLSLDPAMRGWMNAGKSYVRPVEIGEVMRAGGVGEVIASKFPGLQVGDHVSGMLGMQSYAIADGRQLMKVDPDAAPLPKYLSVLGMTGMTAYFGLLHVGQPRPDETVLVSAASGAVGSIVGQIAKIKDCRAIGIAGGPQKCEYAVRQLGFDGCIDYKRGPIFPGLAQNCPQGVDVYFDNVGGDIFDTVLTRLRLHARVVICGAISQYNNTTPIQGPKNYMSLLVNRARMEGFVVFDFAQHYAQAVSDLAQWFREGRLVSQEDIVDGIETFPETLLKLFTGENHGKLILRVDH